MDEFFKLLGVGIAFIGVPMAVVFMGPAIAKAVGRRIDGKTGGGEELAQEVADLRAELGDVEALRHRLAELEERVDFAERMLARQREAAALPPPADQLPTEHG